MSRKRPAFQGFFPNSGRQSVPARHLISGLLCVFLFLVPFSVHSSQAFVCLRIRVASSRPDIFFGPTCRKMLFSAQGANFAILSTLLGPGLSPFRPLFSMQIRMYQKSAPSVEPRRRTGHIFEGRSLPSLPSHVCLSLSPGLSPPLPLFLFLSVSLPPPPSPGMPPFSFAPCLFLLLLSSVLVCKSCLLGIASVWLRVCVAYSSCFLSCLCQRLDLDLHVLWGLSL